MSKGDVNGIADGQTPLPLQEGLNAGTIDEFENEEMFACGAIAAEFEAVDDVGMVEQGAAPAFASEAIDHGGLIRARLSLSRP